MDSALTSPFVNNDVPATRPLAIARWLWLVAAIIFAMVVVGGLLGAGLLTVL